MPGLIQFHRRGLVFLTTRLCTKCGEKVSVLLEIPDQIAHAIRLPPGDWEQSLMTELAVALYARGILPFGKACELSKLKRTEFGLLLGRRAVPRHFTGQDLEDDIAYARSQ